MSTPFLFNIYLITADNRAVPLQFVQDPNQSNQGRLIVGQDLSTQPTSFSVDNHPDFLQRNNGFYLGATYYPKIQFNDKSYYLSLDSNGSYVLSPNSDPNTLSFNLLNPKINWNTPDPIMNFHTNNLNLPGQSPIIGYYFHQPGLSDQQPLTFSAIDCNPSTTHCGEDVCPENFSMVNSKCKPPLGTGIPLGIRTNRGVYTYKIINGKLVAAVAHPSVITAGIETNDTVRERWFYADPAPGDSKLLAGKNYHLYVIFNGKKYYLSNPNVSSNVVTYALSQNPNSQSAVFSPTNKVLPRTTVKATQFNNFVVPGEDTIAVWSHEDELVTSPINNIQSAAAKIQTTASKIENTTTAAKNSPVKSSPVKNPTVNVQRNNIIVPSAHKTPSDNNPITSSFWQEWWFWLSVIGFFIIIILLGWVIYYMMRRNPDVEVVTKTMTTSRPAPPPIPLGVSTVRPLPAPKFGAGV